MKLDLHYIIRRMIKFIWIAVLAGILLAGAMLIKDRNANRRAATETGVTDSGSLRYENYQGDYLSNELACRFIILNYRFKEEAISNIGEALQGQGLAAYSTEYGNLMISRLFNSKNIYMLYGKLVEHFPHIRSLPKELNYSIVPDMLQGLIDHQSSVCVIIKCPELVKELVTNEDLCSYRDFLYSAVSELVDSGELFSDLPVEVIRADSKTEAIAEEQDYVINVLQVDESKQGIQWKKLFLFFALGFAFAEIIVLLVAVLNNTVKSAKDLTNNTDLEVLDEIQAEEGQEHNWKVLAEKLAANVPPKSKLVIIRDSAVSGTEWSEEIGNTVAAIGGELSISELTGLTLSAEELHELSQAKVLIAVKKEKTKYPELRTLSETLRQMKSEVVGAIIEN